MDKVKKANIGQTGNTGVCVCQLTREELRDDGEGLGGVDGKTRSLAVEGRVPQPVGGEVAAVLVADPVVALVGVVVAALGALASES